MSFRMQANETETKRQQEASGLKMIDEHSEKERKQ